MKIIELKKFIEQLPIEFLEYEIVNAEIGEDETESFSYRLDKPVVTLALDEKSKELLILNK